jgi:NAD(P)-dependent dehydrogenase (short-subunit alcohol dehydrogenase family)
MEELSGKVAVVTGAASGIGRALAGRFAREGMSVVLADIERDALDAAAEALAGEHGAGSVLAAPPTSGTRRPSTPWPRPRSSASARPTSCATTRASASAG